MRKRKTKRVRMRHQGRGGRNTFSLYGCDPNETPTDPPARPSSHSLSFPSPLLVSHVPPIVSSHPLFLSFFSSSLFCFLATPKGASSHPERPSAPPKAATSVPRSRQDAVKNDSAHTHKAQGERERERGRGRGRAGFVVSFSVEPCAFATWRHCTLAVGAWIAQTKKEKTAQRSRWAIV